MELEKILGNMERNEQITFLERAYRPGNTQIADLLIGKSYKSDSIIKEEIKAARKINNQKRIHEMYEKLVKENVDLKITSEEIGDIEFDKIAVKSLCDITKYNPGRRIDQAIEIIEKNPGEFNLDITSLAKQAIEFYIRDRVNAGNEMCAGLLAKKYGLGTQLYASLDSHGVANRDMLWAISFFSKKDLEERALACLNDADAKGNYGTIIAATRYLGKRPEVSNVVKRHQDKLLAELTITYEDLEQLSEKAEVPSFTLNLYQGLAKAIQKNISSGDASGYHKRELVEVCEKAHKKTNNPYFANLLIKAQEGLGRYDSALAWSQKIGDQELVDKYKTMTELVGIAGVETK